MSSTETEPTESPEEAVVDEGRSALLEAISNELGDALVDTHLMPGKDLWIRIANEAWASTADYLHNRQRFRFFGWLSAIDWMPSPYGRSLDAEVDKQLAPAEDKAGDESAPSTGVEGFSGGETRFQVLARVHSLATGLGVTLKSDLGPELSIASWTGQYPGADWHEREAYEMFGITFEGHPGLRNIYLPTGFEGHPLRKDYPLLSRLVKPWPGIVDVEPMPEVEQSDAPEESS